LKLLLLDIETAPHISATWGLFDQNVALDQLLEPGYTLCWAAKWHGSKEVMFESIMTGERRMIRRMHRLLDEADAVCHYNGCKFDIPTLNKEFLLQGLRPPAPFKEIDLLRTTRKRFRLASNKLDFVAQALGIGTKTRHKGMALWLGCMKKLKEDWGVMETYNKQDVALLEKVYDRLLPWIVGHPNLSTMNGAEVCPKCASKNKQARGWAILQAGRYQRYQCNDCGSWFRSYKREKGSKSYFREAA
jgi:DNA polymerase elongation subunit (family B)